MNGSRLKLGLVVLALLALTAVTAGDETDWRPLKFLLGDWEGIAKAGEAVGRASFSIELQGNVVVRRNRAAIPAQNGRPAGTHEDQMIIYREGQPAAIHAIYFDSEGHVIRYKAEAVGDGRITFVSEAAPGAPRFRLSYAKLPDGKVGGSFEIAPPGKPEAFGKYLEWVQTPVAPGGHAGS